MKRLESNSEGSISEIILGLQIRPFFEQCQHTNRCASSTSVMKHSVAFVIHNVEVNMCSTVSQKSGGHINGVEWISVLLIVQLIEEIVERSAVSLILGVYQLLSSSMSGQILFNFQVPICSLAFLDLVNCNMKRYSLRVVLNSEVCTFLNKHSYHSWESVVAGIVKRSVAFLVLGIDALWFIF